MVLKIFELVYMCPPRSMMRAIKLVYQYKTRELGRLLHRNHDRMPYNKFWYILSRGEFPIEIKNNLAV